jgi:hypothetical protein
MKIPEVLKVKKPEKKELEFPEKVYVYYGYTAIGNKKLMVVAETDLKSAYPDDKSGNGALYQLVNVGQIKKVYESEFICDHGCTSHD